MGIAAGVAMTQLSEILLSLGGGGYLGGGISNLGDVCTYLPQESESVITYNRALAHPLSRPIYNFN